MTVLIPIILQLCYLGKSSDSACFIRINFKRKLTFFTWGITEHIAGGQRSHALFDYAFDYSSWRRLDSDTWDVSLLHVPWNQW